MCCLVMDCSLQDEFGITIFLFLVFPYEKVYIQPQRWIESPLVLLHRQDKVRVEGMRTRCKGALHEISFAERTYSHHIQIRLCM
mmetsp:Transcript_5577/g.8559  ORF Transcript_5577/g.8559 Transcript_5577/m.8559 type:complete len:84 (+) Transcript_5577:2597-2848(+)